jgi:predicted PurR-regulated permease PerM
MPVDPGQPSAALDSLSDAAEEESAEARERSDASAEETGGSPAGVNDGGPTQAADNDEEAADRMEEAVAEAAEIAEETGGLGELGRPVNRRSPFFIGMAAAAGVAVTYGLVELTIRARSVLILIGLALFIAAGLDPAVTWLERHRFPRWAAVLTILLAAVALVGGFVAAAIPPLVAQATALANHLPHYAHSLQDHNSELGKLNAQYHIQKRLSTLLSSRGSALIGGVLGAGELVVGTAAAMLTIGVMVVYFLFGMPRIRLFAYRLAPHSRRTRVILIGDEIFTKVGGYVLGNFLTSVIAGVGTYIWLLIFGVPYPILLAMLVALLDLIPVIGSTVGGAIVTLVALTVSLPVAIATLGFYIAYRLAEDYLIVPRIMGRTVQVPAVVSLVSVLIGAALMGIVGALVAIPAAAAVRLFLQEVVFRRLDTR